MEIWIKSAYQTGIDPQSDKEVWLFNPRQQQGNEHFRWSEHGSQIIGTTAIGRASVARVQMNRSLAVQARQRWVQAGWRPPKTI